MKEILVAALVTVAMLGCDASYWEKNEREDAERARKEQIRAQEHEIWRAEEHRRRLSLCLEIAKFEKGWRNYTSWEYEPETGDCSVTYKKTGEEKKTEEQCEEERLALVEGLVGGLSVDTMDTLWQLSDTMYELCISDTFSRTWSLKPPEPQEPEPQEPEPGFTPEDFRTRAEYPAPSGD